MGIRSCRCVHHRTLCDRERGTGKTTTANQRPNFARASNRLIIGSAPSVVSHDVLVTSNPSPFPAAPPLDGPMISRFSFASLAFSRPLRTEEAGTRASAFSANQEAHPMEIVHPPLTRGSWSPCSSGCGPSEHGRNKQTTESAVSPTLVAQPHSLGPCLSRCSCWAYLRLEVGDLLHGRHGACVVSGVGGGVEWTGGGIALWGEAATSAECGGRGSARGSARGTICNDDRSR